MIVPTRGLTILHEQLVYSGRSEILLGKQTTGLEDEGPKGRSLRSQRPRMVFSATIPVGGTVTSPTRFEAELWLPEGFVAFYLLQMASALKIKHALSNVD